MALKEEFRRQGDFLFKYRSYLPLIIIAGGLTAFIQSRLEGDLLPWTEQYDIICALVGFLGLVIRCIAVGYSADHTSGRNTSSGQIAEHINTTGFYATCRHPLYLGNFFMWFGIAMYTQDFWFLTAFTFLYWLYYERIMFAEETFLIEKYGSKYSDWAATVPAFIPNLSKWTKPKFSFSWTKIIRQEKTGILNLFIMIFAFKSLGDYLTNGTIIDVKSYWFIGLMIGIAWYIVIKVIQKGTSLLKVDRKTLA